MAAAELVAAVELETVVPEPVEPEPAVAELVAADPVVAELEPVVPLEAELVVAPVEGSRLELVLARELEAARELPALVAAGMVIMSDFLTPARPDGIKTAWER
jgi:hypothetical protein